jgi:predicted ATPase
MGNDDYEVEITLKEELAENLKRELFFWKKNQGKNSKGRRYEHQVFQ